MLGRDAASERPGARRRRRNNDRDLPNADSFRKENVSFHLFYSTWKMHPKNACVHQTKVIIIFPVALKTQDEALLETGYFVYY